MKTTPKSLRLHIGIFGRTNTGKSSLLNLLSGQDAALVSAIAGTTTDTVEKTMELLPVGPVVFLDTAGLDDPTALGAARVSRTEKALDRADVMLLVVEGDSWGGFEDRIAAESLAKNAPLIVAVNKTDLIPLSDAVQAKLENRRYFTVSCAPGTDRDPYLRRFKELLIECVPEDFIAPPPILGDLVPKNGLAALVIPIDSQAPKGRIILPQVQAIRDALDNACACAIARETQYPLLLQRLNTPPDLVVCDSQAVDRVARDTPVCVKVTTFSILFARLKADLDEMAANTAALDRLKPGARVLVSESCSHHPVEEDIGRRKIPRWLSEKIGGELRFDTACGRDFPDNLDDYSLIIQCGGCMQTRRDMLLRLSRAKKANVPITNYGLAISWSKNVLERVLEPFPSALAAYRAAAG
ncbi:MAG: [FeFe] hydrogenase H-cluster maturation GTPase HydF [Elusimicrobiaceae bacterium]|nr:[FeFe] hydrogenase H-cluster maturation GTPase HydF [Elusimicrobiaceae bacterium]